MAGTGGMVPGGADVAGAAGIAGGDAGTVGSGVLGCAGGGVCGAGGGSFVDGGGGGTEGAGGGWVLSADPLSCFCDVAAVGRMTVSVTTGLRGWASGAGGGTGGMGSLPDSCPQPVAEIARATRIGARFFARIPITSMWSAVHYPEESEITTVETFESAPTWQILGVSRKTESSGDGKREDVAPDAQ